MPLPGGFGNKLLFCVGMCGRIEKAILTWLVGGQSVPSQLLTFALSCFIISSDAGYTKEAVVRRKDG